MGAKKWRQTSGEILDRKRKTGAYLMRRGFSGSLVSRVLRTLVQEQDDSEDGETDYDEFE
ncbi:recombination regulator RecX [compost metagenome]